MRLFLAVFPPPEVQALAVRVSDAMRERGDGVSWVRRENVHYTLRFLGELGADGARRAREAAVEAAASHASFDALLAGPGAFPDAKRARVLWLGMGEGAEALKALARSLERALASRGFERADHAFTPHLTLGRVRAPGDWSAKLAGAPTIDARFRVGRIALVKSTLSPGGSQYEIESAAPLAG